MCEYLKKLASYEMPIEEAIKIMSGVYLTWREQKALETLIKYAEKGKEKANVKNRGTM